MRIDYTVTPGVTQAAKEKAIRQYKASGTTRHTDDYLKLRDFLDYLVQASIELEAKSPFFIITSEAGFAPKLWQIFDMHEGPDYIGYVMLEVKADL